MNSFHGHATLGFQAKNSGPDQGNGGTYSAELKRTITSLKIDLTHKQIVHNKLTGTHVFFTGRASGGNASVDDTYDDTGGQFSGTETHSGPLTNNLPNFGSASLFFDQNKCKYQLVVSFGVVTTISGTVDSGSHATVTGSAYSDRDLIPQNLHVVGGDGPPAYGRCPGNPLKTGKTCYQYGTGIVGLCSTSDVGTRHCPADPVGSAHFIWVLLPTFKKK